MQKKCKQRSDVKKRILFLEGVRDGVPIGLGYFAVSFSLGIVAKKAGLNIFQGGLASLLCVASAGEYALFTSIEQSVTYIELALITFVVNARYLLMSCSLSQKFAPKTKFFHRLIIGYGVTDEIFGITIARQGFIQPSYNYGALVASVPLWTIGTALGIWMGNILPLRAVSALSVALYGMFIAIIIPASKKNLVILCGVLASFIFSYAFTLIPFLKTLSAGLKTIILTILISAVMAIIKPVKDEGN